MATDLTKMVERWHTCSSVGSPWYVPGSFDKLLIIIETMAEQIEANREEIEKLKAQANVLKLDQNPDLT